MADACRRRFDAVLVWKIDRFGRSLKHLVNSLAELAALGVALVSLRDNLDLSTPSGQAHVSDYRRDGGIRASANSRESPGGFAEPQSERKRLGRPRVYVNSSRIADLRGLGLSWAQITAETGISKGTAQRALAALPKTVSKGF
jgi:DNA invertase Pin-like site-specific DNA recombinase